jgi:membrane-associated phospholipid phosphatase
MTIRSGKKTYLAIILVTVFAGALFVFTYLALETIQHKENSIDINFAAYSVAQASPSMIKAMRFITLFGGTAFLFVAYCLMIAFFLFKKRYAYAVGIFATSFGAWLLFKGLKILFHRARPETSLAKMPTDYSYPSGHALTSFVFCSIIAWLLWQTHVKSSQKWFMTILLLLFALSIGASRIVLGVHYATDVIGGFALGIVWAMLAWSVWTRWSAGRQVNVE